jgi:valyl-tRNA synthetase
VLFRSDERYAALIGKTIRLPLVNREIPIVADDYVDREFGTGCVKITPAHDFNDYALGQRHHLPMINVLTPDAKIREFAEYHVRAGGPSIYEFADSNVALNKSAEHRQQTHEQFSTEFSRLPFAGLDRFDARKKIVAEFEALGLLEKIEDHKLKVPRGDRSGAVVEPFLTDQWFVDLTRKTQPDGRPGGLTAITQPALDAFTSGAIRFVPENWINTYNQWLHNIQDWCISRQLWWGHRIPAWYDDHGNVYVGRNEAEVRSRNAIAASTALRQDEDVFDTWFSSDIWPLATLDWPQANAALGKWYPSSVLVTGFDIIFFWVARMVMMGVYFTKQDRPNVTLAEQVPFREVYITGLVRDPEGNKMSKSKGNVLDPLDVIDGIALDDLVKKRTTGLMKPETAPKIEAKTRKDYPKGIEAVGVDALRFTFAALATQGRDVRFDASRAAGYRNFCNKIWNAARYVLMNCEGQDCGIDAALPCELSAADRWIISRLQKVEAEAAEHFASYRFDLLSTSLYQFIWNEYCDWYLELSKPALQSDNEAAKRGTRRTLVRVLEAWLRLLHPLMPFITEEVWQQISPLAGAQGDSIMRCRYPISEASKLDEQAEADIEWLKAFILGVRQIRGEMDISPGKTLPLLIQNAVASDLDRLSKLGSSIEFLARVETPCVLGDEEAPQSATALLGTMKLLVPMAGLIDKAAELARLERRIAQLEGDVVKVQARVDNPNFGKAPEAVQQQARDLLAKQLQDLAALRVQHEKIAAL